MRTTFLALTLCLLGLPVSAKYSGGTGEPNDPYQIATAVDLIALGQSTDAEGKNFVLTADIDLDPNLPGRKVFDSAPIGIFNGVFDGAGHMISHLKIVGQSYLGLFGQLGGKVSNLGLIVDIRGTGEFVGGLAGENDGTVVGCYSTGTVSGNLYLGGLVGVNDRSITMSYNSCSVAGNGPAMQCIGGLVGQNWGGGSIATSYNDGSVSGGESSATIAGLVGINHGSIVRCYNRGSVVGYCGLVCSNAGRIVESYSACSLSLPRTTGGLPNGGLVGRNYPPGTIDSSFWEEIPNPHFEVKLLGVRKTTAEMQTAQTFLSAGWDFIGETANGTEDIWWIDEGKDYPHLWWEPRKYGGGTGEPNTPYLIFTAEQLNDIGAEPVDWNKHFKLMVDIDLSAFNGKFRPSPFNIIGDCSSLVGMKRYLGGTPFTGVFDGNGHKISHLGAMKARWGCRGLFGGLGATGQIKDLGVMDVNVASFDGPAGGLVGRNDGVVAGCYTSGLVKGTGLVGGLVGYNTATVNRCYSACSVTATSEQAGGLAGYNSGSVIQCYSRGAVKGDGSVGGLVGYGGKVNSSFWDTKTSGQATSAGGTGKVTAEMQMAQTFLSAGWDFVGETANGSEDIWWIDEGKDYPHLGWEQQ